MIKFNNTINFKINKRVRYKNYYITIIYNKFANLRICYYIFRTNNINVNQYFNFQIVIYIYIFLYIND